MNPFKTCMYKSLKIIKIYMNYDYIKCLKYFKYETLKIKCKKKKKMLLSNYLNQFDSL